MSEIITFYSYKGGVGRTMALANVSVVLAKWGCKVLVVDWDLEAPGLEHFYKGYIDVGIVANTNGVIDLLTFDDSIKWQDSIIPISIPDYAAPIHFISSGRRDEDYFTKVRNFDVDSFYEQQDGGDIVEKLRNEWLANYDYVLIDSRTGITEIGGICTIQLPDIVVMLFTATNHGFEGALDIMKRASAAQQKLPYDRLKLIYLPIVSKFETNTEFELSQKWLKIFEEKLEKIYGDWLHKDVNRKEFLELTKIPYIPYFSFGEKLPVIEQGVKDPSGLGYAYETLAGLIGNHLNFAELLINNREKFIANIYPEYFVENDGIKDANILKLNQLKQKFGITSEAIVLHKSKNVIIDCVSNNILPLFNKISLQMKEVGVFFKSNTEHVNIYGHSANSKINDASDISNFLTKLYDLYNSIFINNYDIDSLVYLHYFNQFRNTQNYDANIVIGFMIKFYRTSYELIFYEKIIFANKLYSEAISEEESEKIAQTMSASVLHQIETLTNK